MKIGGTFWLKYSPVFNQQFILAISINAKVASEVDSEIEKLVLQGEKKAKEVLSKHKPKLKKLSELLLKKETLERAELEKVI